MERKLTQNSKEAINAKKQLMEEKLAMSKATREWQEDWTQRLKKHHFEAVASTEDRAELTTLRERVSSLETELQKERQDYKVLKKEAGTTYKFLQKERNRLETEAAAHLTRPHPG